MERENEDINQRFTVLLNVQDAKVPFRILNLYICSIGQCNINKSYARWNLNLIHIYGLVSHSNIVCGCQAN